MEEGPRVVKYSILAQANKYSILIQDVNNRGNGTCGEVYGNKQYLLLKFSVNLKPV